MIAELLAEVERQDQIHPAGFPATRDGIRLGMAVAEDELQEAHDAWHVEKKQSTLVPWNLTRGELLQAMAVIFRIVREIESVPDFYQGLDNSQ